VSRIWDNNLEKLQEFKAEFGHLNVPKSYPDKQLARLVTTLRQQKRYNSIKPDRELALHQLGFDFEPQQTQWMTNYRQLVEFYRLTGHSSPYRRCENQYERVLADWVHRMHKLVRRGELSSDKVNLLNLIYVDGHPSDHKMTKAGLPLSFEKMLSRLQTQVENNGTVIHSQIADPALYSWLQMQQQRIQSSVIAAKEFSMLMKTGFEFEKVKPSNLRLVSNG